MCGIIGYFGPKDPKEVILNGLKTLEYRGYDSAGISIWDKSSFKRVRSQGKIHRLEEKLKVLNFEGSLGIGHIRWATHGAPHIRNAHPHKVGDVTLVHNGVIENYWDLKKDLLEKGVVFQSETDSELLAHLISKRLLDSSESPFSPSPHPSSSSHSKKTLFEAVLSVLPLLKGSYATLVVSEQHSDEIIAFKKDLSLILGQKSHSVMIASDIEALLPHTQNVMYLDDNEIAHIKGSDVQIFSTQFDSVMLDDFLDTSHPKHRFEKEKDHLWRKNFHLSYQKVGKKRTPISLKEKKTKKEDKEDIKKGSIKNKVKKPVQNETDTQSPFMLREIFEQPEKVKELIQSHIHPTLNRIFLPDLSSSTNILEGKKKIFLLACGSSYYAALQAKYVLEKFSRLSVEVDMASEFRYRNPVIPKNSLMILVSQSGETADTLSLLQMSREEPSLDTLGICNVKHSSLARQVKECLFLRAGKERGVASTKTFTNTLLLFYLLARILEMKDSDHKSLLPSLFSLPHQMKALIQKSNEFFEKKAPQWVKHKGFLYLGRGPHYPIALEGALKVKELAYRHAEGYAAGEMKHGPLALVDSSLLVFVLAPMDSYYRKTLNNLIEIKTRGGKVVAIGSEGDERLQALSDEFISLPKALESLYPILEVIPLQFFAYHMAKILGHDIDRPRNLAKSVTVE